jgi:hypothetical protein
VPVELVVRDIISSLITGIVILGVAFSPIGRALAHRIMHGKAPRALPVADDPRMDDLSGEVASLREQLDTTLDRLDFTERMLAQVRERAQLGAGGDRPGGPSGER